MTIPLRAILLCTACLFFASCFASSNLWAVEPPPLRMVNGTGQLIVNGQPFLILGGELGNSSARTAPQADQIFPKLKAMHVNTILTPVAGEQIEAKEGTFDFSILDHWIETSRRHNMHLVLLCFGSWKNAFSNYSPGWVKSNPKRFPRAESSDGKPLEILSTLSAENRQSDARGKTWNEVFGEAADEVFMAWNYATYIEAVARAGKHEYLLQPMSTRSFRLRRKGRETIPVAAPIHTF